VGAGANFHGRPVLSILAKFASTSDRHDYPTCATSTSARGSSVGYSDAHCAVLTRDPLHHLLHAIMGRFAQTVAIFFRFHAHLRDPP
jgi:hypothetical protein